MLCCAVPCVIFHATLCCAVPCSLCFASLCCAALPLLQGGKSVEVRPVGVSKGAAMERILGEIVHQRGMAAPFDYVMVVGHFLARVRDETRGKKGRGDKV